MSVSPPVRSGRIPGLGHIPRLLRDPFGFLASLSHVGEVVTIFIGRRPVHVVTSQGLVREVLTTHSGAFRRGLIFEKASKIFGEGLIVSEGEKHRRHRRLLQPAFHRQQITRYTDAMRRVFTERASSWRADEPLGMYSETHDMALEVLGHTLFRADLAVYATEQLKQALPGIVPGITAQALYPAKWLERVPLPVNRRFGGRSKK